MNIKFNYMYRDASNYKICESLTFSNENNRLLTELEEIIRLNLIDGEFFDPLLFRVPLLSFEIENVDDHKLHEYCGLELTDENNIFQSIEYLIEMNKDYSNEIKSNHYLFPIICAN